MCAFVVRRSRPFLPPVGLTSAVQFLKKTMGVTEDDPQKELKDELKHLFSKLCGKLDALCNFHYTPKAAIPEMKVRLSEHERRSVERPLRFMCLQYLHFRWLKVQSRRVA